MNTLQELDPYGTDIAFSPSGDLIVNSAGALESVGGLNVLAQALYDRIKTGEGELVLHPEYGISQPIGAKLNHPALVNLLTTELANVPGLDPRFQSVRLKEAPVQPTDGIALEATVIAAGGTIVAIQGLPGEARIGEVSPATPETALSSLEEEEAYGEAEPPELEEYNATQALVEELEE